MIRSAPIRIDAWTLFKAMVLRLAKYSWKRYLMASVFFAVGIQTLEGNALLGIDTLFKVGVFFLSVLAVVLILFLAVALWRHWRIKRKFKGFIFFVEIEPNTLRIMSAQGEHYYQCASEKILRWAEIGDFLWIREKFTKDFPLTNILIPKASFQPDDLNQIRSKFLQPTH